MYNRPKIGCMIMASGLGERYGKNKLLEVLCGREVVLRVLDCVSETDVDEILIVTRWEGVRNLIEAEKARGAYGTCAGRIRTVLYEGGEQSASLRTGLLHLTPCDACLFTAGDQPLLKPASVTRLLEAWRQREESERDTVFRLSYGGTGKNPVLFPKMYFDGLRGLTGDRGGGQLIRRLNLPVRLVEADSEEELLDIDTPKDFSEAEHFLMTL